MTDIQIRMGEVKLGLEDDILKSTLGSCVGIAFYWRQKKIGGLAHCLLPKAPIDLNLIGAKYVDQAIKSLLILMKISPDEFYQVEVSVAGGGNMMNQLSARNASQVGKHNAETVVTILEEFGFKILRSDLGGYNGRQMVLNCSNGLVEIIKLEKIAV